MNKRDHILNAVIIALALAFTVWMYGNSQKADERARVEVSR
jgi:hypothetical protein